jgi:ribose transport system substrate-binding protein
MSIPFHLFRVLTLAMVFMLVGCGDKPVPTPPVKDKSGAAKQRGVIGLSVLTMANPFFKEIADTMRDEAAKHGYELAVVSADFDVNKQQNQVKDFIVRKVAAIVLTPANSRAIGTAIKEANAAGIPVFTADIAAIGEGIDVLSHIATDNFAGGQQAAIAIVEAIGGRGKIAILDHPEVESVMLRTKGFKEKLAELNKVAGNNVEIVATLPGGGDREKSFKATLDLLQSNADLAGVFAINDPSALGAVGALESVDKLGAVKVVGFDGMLEGKKAIRAGKMYADPIQFPDKIARQTVRAIVSHFDGEKVERQTLIPTALYRKIDAEQDKALD